MLQLAKQLKIPFFETSAKEGEHIEQVSAIIHAAIAY